jgi:hypothetical protein
MSLVPGIILFLGKAGTCFFASGAEDAEGLPAGPGLLSESVREARDWSMASRLRRSAKVVGRRGPPDERQGLVQSRTRLI